jgi:DNA-binding transcriptional LysR family regulator
MNDRAEFRHFRYLLAILELQGFRAAAEHLHTAQPNLSTQAKKFQDDFGLHLYRKRKDGRIRLTQTGLAFKPIAQGLLDARDEAIAELIAVERGEIRSLKFGCSPCVDRGLFHTACEIHREIVPGCPIRPAHSETVQLEEETVSGQIDAAILTMPVSNVQLRLEVIRRDRLVACLRKDHPCAQKIALSAFDLQENLAIFHDPQRHPRGHQELVERLASIGVVIEEYARASHPVEMQELVREGYGLALIREGSLVDDDLVTRPISGVDWIVDTAIVYKKQSPLKSLPVLVRHLKRYLTAAPDKQSSQPVVDHKLAAEKAKKKPPQSVTKQDATMTLVRQ